MATKKMKVDLSTQQKLEAIKRLNKVETMQKVADDCGGGTVGDWIIIVKAAIIIKADKDYIINLLNFNCDIFTWSFNNFSLLYDATSAPFMLNKQDSTLTVLRTVFVLLYMKS